VEAVDNDTPGSLPLKQGERDFVISTSYYDSEHELRCCYRLCGNQDRLHQIYSVSTKLTIRSIR
jgi:hypothetical protein